ncbi:Cell shape-determining protein MreC [Burkholderiales bacterium]|nr:Cell shape-determining protein MreC [Burkholderiales bacterium]
MPAYAHEPPPFFRRGPSPLARFAFFGLLSLVLLVTDSRFAYLEAMRGFVGSALLPLQSVATWPGEAAERIGDYFASQRGLQGENEALQRQLLAQAQAVQGHEDLVRENARLRALLQVRERYGGSSVPAEVLYGGRDPFRQKLVIGFPSSTQIKAGQAVIDETGVIGQVTRSFHGMAEVTLLTDKDHAVPVKVRRSGLRSVLYGAGAGRAPELRFMAANADIQPGDVLVTSGIDGVYPPDLAVAAVTSVERETGLMFARIVCQPLAGVDRSRQVLILEPLAALPERPEAESETEARKKGARARRR